MAYLDDLRAARDRYAQELAERIGPPAQTRWDEYERWLLEQIERINALLEQADQSAMDQPVGTGWSVRRAATRIDG